MAVVTPDRPSGFASARSDLAALAVGLLACALACGVVVWLALRQTGGHLVYALDDPYIHMAVAADLVRHGTWGINPQEFAGTSSSPLWTLLLAGLWRVFGVADAWPLGLNLAAAAGVVVACWHLLRPVVRSWALAALLVGMVLFACLPTLVLIGMEHTLHTLLAVWGMGLAATVIAGPAARETAGRPSRAAGVWLCVAVAMTVSVRFEGLFFAVAVALLLAFRRWFFLSGAVLLAAALPVALYALVSIPRGGAWLPNPVLLKGGVPHGLTAYGVKELLLSIPRKVPRAPHLFALLAAAVGWWAALTDDEHPAARRFRAMLALFALTTLAHLQFAQTGWLFRYEAYLIAVGTVAVAGAAACRVHSRVVGVPASPAPRRPWLGVVMCITPPAMLAAAVCLAARGAIAFHDAPGAARNIYEQQYQIARFVRASYPGQAVAVHDIGAVAFYGDARVLDLWGLADDDVFRLTRAGAYDPAARDELCRRRGVRVAIVYPSAFDATGGLPPGWRRVETWTTQDMVIKTGDTVGFYATDPAAAEELARALDRFAPRLPPQVLRRPEGRSGNSRSGNGG